MQDSELIPILTPNMQNKLKLHYFLVAAATTRQECVSNI